MEPSIIGIKWSVPVCISKTDTWQRSRWPALIFLLKEDDHGNECRTAARSSSFHSMAEALDRDLAKITARRGCRSGCRAPRCPNNSRWKKERNYPLDIRLGFGVYWGMKKNEAKGQHNISGIYLRQISALDEAMRLEHLFSVRYGQGHICPKVRAKSQVVSDASRARPMPADCAGIIFYPTAGTMFEDTRTPLKLGSTPFICSTHLPVMAFPQGNWNGSLA